MVIEFFTLIVLAGALTVKFLTTRHTESLELHKTEVDNEHKSLRGKHDSAIAGRKEVEDRLRLLEIERIDFERHINDAEEELDERIKRNEELEGN
jgi:hypothetical protein